MCDEVISGNCWLCFFVCAMLLGVAAGCTTAGVDRQVDRRVAEEGFAWGGFERSVEDFQAEAAPRPERPESPVGLDAVSVLELGTLYSRTLQGRRDDLRRAGLDLFGTERDFEFGFSGTVSFIAESGEDRDSQGVTGSLETSRILPTGGRVRASTQGGRQTVSGEETERETTVSGEARVRIDQPLGAGAGYGVAYEPLIQARRNFVYALRDFSLQRQDLAIETLRGFYNLASQRMAVENTRLNLQQFEFLRKRSEALFQVNRAPAIDVLRSQQQELSALNRLTGIEERYQIAVGRFLLQLGLPPDWPVEIGDPIPELKEVRLSEEAVTELALERRVDFQTVREREEDALRRLAVARNARWPEVNAFGEAVWSGSGAERFSDLETEQVVRGGVSMVLPIDQRSERDGLRRAMLEVEAAKRRTEERRDQIRLEVRESFSQLRTQQTAVEIERQNIEIAERRVTNATLLFRSGRLSNRDVIEAENQLLDARNAFVQALVDYEIQRLTLLRNIGLLDVDARGRMVELPFPGEEMM